MWPQYRSAQENLYVFLLTTESPNQQHKRVEGGILDDVMTPHPYKGCGF